MNTTEYHGIKLQGSDAVSDAVVGIADELYEMRKDNKEISLQLKNMGVVFNTIAVSKLVDYIGAKKPILAITPEGSCADIVKEAGGLVHSPSSVQSIENGIVLAINNLRSGFLPTMQGDYTNQFSNSIVAKQFDIMFDQLIQR